jgi:hypothetical protein
MPRDIEHEAAPSVTRPVRDFDAGDLPRGALDFLSGVIFRRKKLKNSLDAVEKALRAVGLKAEALRSDVEAVPFRAKLFSFRLFKGDRT